MTNAIQATFIAAIIGACVLLGFSPELQWHELIGLIVASIMLRAWSEITDQREEVLALQGITRSLADDVALHDRKRGQA
jgi:uncharacterized membrane protein